MKDWVSSLIMGTGAAALIWVWWCTWHDINPVGWFR